MSVLLPDPAKLERKQDKDIAIEFARTLETQLANTKDKEDFIEQLKTELKDLTKNHPYLVGLVIGILVAKYLDIAKEVEK